MNPITKFINHIGDACGAREYSPRQIINKLDEEIGILFHYLIHNEPGTDTWNAKRKLMLDKINNLNQIKEENLNN